MLTLWSASGADKKVHESPHANEVNERCPRSLQAFHLKPLKREVEHGIPTCDLQLRSYSLQPLDFFADFALRAAYYLGLPASGPVPLPRLTQRWTVPRDHFIFKKSQENFERITLRRLIQIKDGNPETVELWLAYLRKNQYYGVGMKANMWEFSELGVGKIMEREATARSANLEDAWSHLGQTNPEGVKSRVHNMWSSFGEGWFDVQGEINISPLAHTNHMKGATGVMYLF